MSRSNPNSIFAALLISSVLLTMLFVACSATITVESESAARSAMRWVDQFASQGDDETMGSDPARWVVGGGAGYGEWADSGTITVATKDELLDALRQSHAGDVIYVEDNAKIDLTGIWDTRIPAGVTLASGRGRNGSLGALLYTRENVTRTLFDIRGSGVRITGLRLRGPSIVIYPGGCPLNARGITVRAPTNPAGVLNVEIDNNELWAWPNSAISVVQSESVYVHHNHIHHNRRIAKSLTEDPIKGCANGAYGLGYGVNVTGAHVYIDANLFDHNRHDIASDGSPNSGYTARYNVVLPNPSSEIEPRGVAHSFDMHGFGEQRQYNRPPPYEAGDKIVIHHNTFLLAARAAIVIRGTPKTGAWISQNQFVETQAKAVLQRNTDITGTMTIWPNLVNIFDVENNDFSVVLDATELMKGSR